jgi:hypothetical protein
MDTAIDLIKSFDNVMAKSQQFLVPSEGHSSISPFGGFRQSNTLHARPRVFKSGIPRGSPTQKLPASLLAYGAKLWSACSLLPLLPAPACWRLVHSMGVRSYEKIGLVDFGSLYFQ